MILRRRSDAPVSRGQALVETALILPILLLLLVIAADFGRVFFGWIALQNAARVGADFAAQTSVAWDGTPAEEQENRDRYVALIEADMRTINCDLADGGTIPDPVFEDGLDTISPDGTFDDGDYVIVELECSFGLMTPLAESIFGGPIPMGAREAFPIHRGIVQAVPEGPVVPICIGGEAQVPDMVGETMEDALDAWTGAGFQASNFLPAVVSSGPPSGRNNEKLVLDQDLEPDECLPTASTVVQVDPEP